MDLPAGARVGNQRGESVQCRFRGTGIGVRRRVAPCTPRRLLVCSWKFDEIAFLLVRESEIEALVVKFDHVRKGRGRAVVEIWSPCRQSTQNGPLDLAD